VSHRARTAMAVVAAATLVAGAPAMGARNPKSRSQTLEYVGGGVTAGSDRSTVLRVGDNVGAVVFRGGPERFVSIEIKDAHGLPVTGIVAQPDESGTHICGATHAPLPIQPFKNVTVFLMNGACRGAVASVVTTGTVTATFKRR
jgi:hypothetical protein